MNQETTFTASTVLDIISTFQETLWYFYNSNAIIPYRMAKVIDSPASEKAGPSHNITHINERPCRQIDSPLGGSQPVGKGFRSAKSQEPIRAPLSGPLRENKAVPAKYVTVAQT